MERIICHWTAGAHKANATDREHYHILIEGDGKLVRGDHPITANHAPVSGGYAAHTLNCNTGSIGVSLCCMAGAKESPFDPGKYPMTRAQLQKLAEVVADLCRRYSIPVTRSTVLSHAEVQQTLGIKQRQKWTSPDCPSIPTPRALSSSAIRCALRSRRSFERRRYSFGVFCSDRERWRPQRSLGQRRRRP